MKYIWILSLLLIYLISCKPKSEEYYIKKIWIGERLIDTTKVTIKKEKKANKISLTYETKLDTISYIIDNKNKRESKLIAPSYESDTFYLVKEYFVTTENKNYKIYHFSTFDGTIDGGSEHYWNEDLGIFFTRGRSWSRYSILQSTDENKNRTVWDIIKQVYPEIKERLEYRDLLDQNNLIFRR